MRTGNLYQPLADFLAGTKADSWEASFAEIEEKLGRALPPSAHNHQAWWANQSGAGHSQTHGWRSVGWRTAGLDIKGKKVRFERDAASHQSPGGKAERSTDVGLLERAQRLTGIRDERLLIDEALRALIEREAAAHLKAIGRE